MKTVIQRYGIQVIWHFTDESNLELIMKHEGLLSLGELERRGVNIPTPGGNDWSHDADKRKGLHECVHLSFTDDHPMLFVARNEGRITKPIWLKIDASVMLEEGVQFSSDVSNKSGVKILDAAQAIEEIDFEVLFTWMDWRNPDIMERRKKAIKSEVLIPRVVPIAKIVDWKYG